MPFDYLSLVAKSGQVNTPPGSYNTVKEWIRESFLTQHSNVLEVGCSMGFITIEICRYTGAVCYGLDLHKASVRSAKENVDSYLTNRTIFVCGDAGSMHFVDNQFSHVVVGGHLPFIPAEMRTNHIAEAIRVVKPWGYILTALYFYKTPPPQMLVEEFNAEIGTNLSANHNYEYWTSLFDNQRLTLEYESVNEVEPANPARIQAYLQQLSEDTRSAWVTRLKLFNDNGKYLNYFVRVYRKLPDEGEVMLQVPRGGIYTTRRISQRYF